MAEKNRVDLADFAEALRIARMRSIIACEIIPSDGVGDKSMVYPVVFGNEGFDFSRDGPLRHLTIATSLRLMTHSETIPCCSITLRREPVAFFITLPNSFKIGDTVARRINQKPKRVTWRDKDTLVIEPTRHHRIRIRCRR
jgi:hypothetical protein